MTNIKTTLTLISGTFAILALGGRGLPCFSASKLQGPLTEAPATVYGVFDGYAEKKEFANSYRAHAAPNPANGSVDIRILEPVPEPTISLFPHSPILIKSTTVSFATRYWPTSFEWIEGSSTSIVVGIMPSDGETVIVERWEFDTGAPTATEVVDANTGETSVEWKIPPRKKVVLLMRKKFSRLGLAGVPSFIIENRGAADANRFYIGAKGETSIFHLDVATGTCWPAAQFQAGANGALVVPELDTTEWLEASGVVHSTNGLVYTLSLGNVLSPKIVHLIDSDSDGEFDAWDRFSNSNPQITYGPLDTEVLSEF